LVGSAHNSPEEIKNLLAISDRDLLACQVKQLPADWRCTIAYNAALQAATAALAAAGYREESSRNLFSRPSALPHSRQPEVKSQPQLALFIWII
jgi:hypothetical protein